MWTRLSGPTVFALLLLMLAGWGVLVGVVVWAVGWLFPNRTRVLPPSAPGEPNTQSEQTSSVGPNRATKI
jgi:hypothetical protein